MKWIKRDGLETVKDVFLRNIGASSLEEINEWHRKSHGDGYRIDGLKEAAELIMLYKDKNVTVVGDYDSDGINSVVIMLLTLKSLGFSNVKYRIPRRFTEGYGISETIIDEIESGLIITVDNGIAQTDVIRKAKEKGLTVIVTDHHLPVTGENGEAILPPADIIIDPNAIEKSADFNGYCGAGIAYKLAKALLGEKESDFTKKLLAFAGIATITDVMELKEENYIFVREALKIITFPASITTGLYALVCALNLSRHISAHDIGFRLGPTINAASRMADEGANTVVELLMIDDRSFYAYAVESVEKLVTVNEERKEAKKEGLAKAKEIIAEECLYGDTPLVVNIPGVAPGIIGIIAGQLAEDNKTPAIVLSETEDGILKGSARSYGAYNMKEELDKVSTLLLTYGGHPGAAGLSLKKENLEKLRAAMLENAPEMENGDIDALFYDLEISASEIPAVIEELAKYEPFGEGNPEIVFKVNKFSCIPKNGKYIKTIGDGSIIKLYSTTATAVGFGLAEQFEGDKKKVLDLVGVLSDNYFNGVVEHEVDFQDFKEVASEKVETPLALRLKAMAAAR